MSTQDLYAGLPDPDLSPEFYQDVPSKRLFAWIVDTVLIIIITIVLIPFTAFTAIFYLPFLALVVSLFYRIVSIARRSATPGMRLMSLEFRTNRGEKFDLSMAALHTIIFTISVSFVLPQIVSVILMLTGSRAQGLSDHLLGTAAVNRAATY